MSITLSDGATTLALDPDLKYADQFTWSPVEQIVDRSVTGALIVQAAARVKGRPITLQPPDEAAAWMPLSAVQQLLTWAAVPLKQLTLTIRGTAYTVIFRHQDGAHEADPVVFYSDPDATDSYLVTIRLMEV